MKRKLIWELVVATLFVFVSTYFVYSYLASDTFFWNAQILWSIALALCWVIVATGYYHQGWMVHKKHSAENVSIILPIAVFCVQLILFVKGIFYHDWSLIFGAVVVNSGVLFSLYQIIKTRGKK